MSRCPNRQKQIKKDASFCPYCQKPIRGKAGIEKDDIYFWGVIALITFLFPFFVLVEYQFFTTRLEHSDISQISLWFLFLSAFIALVTVNKKPRKFRFLSLFFNLSIILWYAIWVNTLGFITN